MLIPIFIVFAGFAGLLIVIGRKLSVASGETYELVAGNGEVAGGETSITESNLHVLPLQTLASKIRFSFRSAEVGDKTKRLGEKFIRRAHIGLLKLDNRLLRWLELCSAKSILRESSSVKSKNRIYFKNLLAISKNLGNTDYGKKGDTPQEKKVAEPIRDRIKPQASFAGSRQTPRPFEQQPDKVALAGSLEQAMSSNRAGSDNVTKSAKDKDKAYFSPKSKLAPSSYEEFWLGILRQNPKNPHPYKRLGEIYMQQGLYEEAEAVFTYALKHNSKDPELTSWIKNIKIKRAEKVASHVKVS